MNGPIVLYIHSLTAGGAERVAATLASGWARDETQVVVVTNGAEEDDFYVLDRRVRRVAMGLSGRPKWPLAGVLMNCRRVWALRQEIRRTQPCALVGFMPTANILCWLASMGMRVRVVGSEHAYPPALALSSGWARLRRLAYRRVHCVTAPTQAGAEHIRKETGARAVHAIPNPIPFPLPESPPRLDPDEFRKDDPPEKLLLAAGRLHREKGYDMLLHAFSRVADRHPEWRLVILGEGRERASLSRLRQELGLDTRVDIPGACGNLSAWYESADLFTLTSRSEGFGNSLAEALAHGLPAVAVDCPTGPREILRHEVDGLLVPCGDTAALAGALDRAMASQSLRASFAARAVEARKRFHPERIVGQWNALCLSA